MMAWLLVLAFGAAPEADEEGAEPAPAEGEAATDEAGEDPVPTEPVPQEASEEEDPEARAKAAEARRLRQELVNAAKAGRHEAVDRTYRTLIGMDEPIPDDIHELAADAARSRGDVLHALARLQRADSEELLADLQGRYGAVRLSVPIGAELSGGEHFAPDEIAAVQWTRDALAIDGRYVGLLPAGTYKLAGREVVVPAGDLVAVVVD